VSDRKFIKQLQDHRGGIVRVKANWIAAGMTRDACQLHGKVGLLLDWAATGTVGYGGAYVDLLIDERVTRVYFYPEELELIGGEDEFR
jgi:hypothetical protein